ncbi:MAG: DNA alkylation repair protein [Methanomassiliicoccales archaeon]|jgi:3-methyladenine DNA glycosylase AlkD|nr:DNA alkylation repair protein [Methanomassiliicoccales archaeon]
MEYLSILEELKRLSNPNAVKGMARFGINPENTYGVSIPTLRRMARKIGKNHFLALQLWSSGIHEARILASMIDDPDQVTGNQMDLWIRDFDSWDVCDQCCMNLFSRTSVAWEKAVDWTDRESEFEKRAGFVLIACLAWYNKKTPDNDFMVFLPLIRRGASDNRNYVKKAVSWALRNIGKRSLYLNSKAIETAKEIQSMDSRSARWIASDAIRELTSEGVKKRLRAKEK